MKHAPGFRNAAPEPPVRGPRNAAGSRWIDDLRSRVLAALGWRRWAMAFIAGAVSVLALAPFHVWPVLFVTMPVLVWLIDGPCMRSDPLHPASRSHRDGNRKASDPIRAAFTAGWWFGFGYFVFGLFWVGEAFLVEADKYALLIPFAVTLLPAGLAFFFAAAAAAARAMWPPGAARILVLAVALGLTEWLRGHILTGLPWNTLGYALAYPLPLMQAASIFGTYGLTLWVVLVGAGPLVMAADAATGPERPRIALAGLAIAAVPLVVFAAYGALKLAREPAPFVDGVRFRIVQPSVPQREKWRPENQGPIFRDHLDLSRHDASGRQDDLEGVTHVVWPEAAMPFLPLEHPEAIDAIGKTLPIGTYLFSGGLRIAAPQVPALAAPAQPAPQPPANPGERRIYNSLLVFGAGGGLAAIYDKNHLVPFGEYLPLPQVWRAFGLRGLVEMRGAFNSGPDPRPLLDIPGLPKVGALICYEAIFPGEVVQGKERPGLLLSVTNDGWFGNTTGPRQHFHQAQVRAVEEGLPLVRAANNGISAMIDPEGRVLQRLDMNVRGVIDSGLPAARPTTLYARFGDWVLLANALLFAMAAYVLARRRR